MNRRQGHGNDLSVLSDLAPQLATTFVSVASDIALVIDDDGIIRNVAVGNAEALAPPAEDWVGRPWAETVTADTRPKIEQLLNEAFAAGVSRRREVNLPSVSGVDIPVAYAAIRLGAGGPVLAVGRDLRAIAAIQQRFFEMQGELERDYWQRRQAESRYRLMFEVAHDAVFVVDADTLQIVDANAAAARLYGRSLPELLGQRATIGLDRASRPAIEELLAAARGSGRPAEIRARLLGGRASTRISATPFSSGDAMLLLVRASDAAALGDGRATPDQLAALVERTPDAIVVCDSAGHVRMANPAFLAMAGLQGESQALGRPLSEWLGRSTDAVDAAIAAAHRQGVVRDLRLDLSPAHGTAATVEVSATLLPEGDQEGIGFVLRRAGGLAVAATPCGELAAAITHLSAQFGAIGLPALLQRATGLVERHFLSVALDAAAGDPGRAAALLGITVDALGAIARSHGLEPAGASAPAPATVPGTGA